MKILLPMIASVSLYPPATHSWSFGPRYYGLDVWSPGMLQRQQAMLQRQQSMFQKVFSTETSTPRYEITDTHDKFQVSIDVPGIKPEDIRVSFEEDESVLSIRGSRSMISADESRSYSSQFSQSFSVDPTVDVNKFTANLKNGVLVISAPKDMKRIEENIRNIPVMIAADEESAAEASSDEKTHDDETSKNTTDTSKEKIEEHEVAKDHSTTAEEHDKQEGNETAA